MQNTADYIYQLEQEKTRLLEQNCQLKRRVINSQSNQDSDGSCSDSPLPKRKKRDAGMFNACGFNFVYFKINIFCNKLNIYI